MMLNKDGYSIRQKITAGIRQYKIAILVFVLALLPRIAKLGLTLKVNDLLWLKRSHDFVFALLHFDLGNTFQTLHPAVTVMYTSGFTMGLQYLLTGSIESTQAYLFAAFLPTALLTALLASVVYVATVRLLPETQHHQWIAGIAAILTGFDPFLLGNSRATGRDSLLVVFMIFALLAFLWYLDQRRPPRAVVIAGIMTGLAILTKLPGLLLFPILGAIYLLEMGISERISIDRFREGVGHGVLFTLAATVTFVGLWPAMWVEPGFVINRLLFGVTDNTMVEPSGWNSTPTIVITVRNWIYHSSPINLFVPPLYLPVVGIAVWRSKGLSALKRDNALRLFTYGLIFVLGFVAPMAIAEQSGPMRYILPIVPVVSIMSAIATVRAAKWAAQRASVNTTKLVGSISSIIIACMIIWVAILHPYPILSANPVAQEVIYPDRTPGEAVVAESIAARELQTSENADEMIVATGAPNYFDVFFHGNGRVAMIGGTWQESRAGLFPPVNTSHGVASSPTMWNRSYTWEELDYLVLTTNYMNRGLHPEAIQRCFYDAEPIEKITANGYVVARVYDADSCTPTFDTGVSRSNNVTMTTVPTP